MPQRQEIDEVALGYAPIGINCRHEHNYPDIEARATDCRVNLRVMAGYHLQRD